MPCFILSFVWDWRPVMFQLVGFYRSGPRDRASRRILQVGPKAQCKGEFQQSSFVESLYLQVCDLVGPVKSKAQMAVR